MIQVGRKIVKSKEVNSKPLKNYMFNWIDENGKVDGWNSVWATGKVEAKKLIKEMETPAFNGVYGRMTGMYLYLPSLKVVSEKRYDEQVRATNMD